jgi:hypothetical protein
VHLGVHYLAARIKWPKCALEKAVWTIFVLYFAQTFPVVSEGGNHSLRRFMTPEELRQRIQMRKYVVHVERLALGYGPPASTSFNVS